MKRKILAGIFIINCIIYPQTALSQSSSLFKIQTDSPQILKEQALIFYKKGNYKEAINFLNNIDLNSQDNESLLLTANSYDNLDNIEKSSDYLKKIIEINPNNSFAYYNLGILSHKKGELNAAIENFDKAIKYNKNFSAAYYNMGVCYYETQEYKKAIRHFNKTAKIDPLFADTYYNIALTYEILDKQEKSKKYYDLYNTVKKSAKDRQEQFY